MPGPSQPSPQGGAPNQPPAQGTPPSASQPQGQGGTNGGIRVLQSIDQAIDTLMPAIQKEQGLSPEAKKMFMAIDDLFGKFMDEVKAGAGAGPENDDEESSQGQTTDPMAGGNKGAIPAY